MKKYFLPIVISFVVLLTGCRPIQIVSLPEYQEDIFYIDLHQIAQESGLELYTNEVVAFDYILLGEIYSSARSGYSVISDKQTDVKPTGGIDTDDIYYYPGVKIKYAKTYGEYHSTSAYQTAIALTKKAKEVGANCIIGFSVQEKNGTYVASGTAVKK
ncbi:hypothetical protein [uncultured Duncaniella sp.]|nr:hypothetical protein [uncultured Duncaniella sp.]